MPPIPDRLRISAVSYLNTVPLVWGMLHGPQQGLFDLQFGLPSQCADGLANGAADIGIVPSFELTRQDLEVIPGTGIACRGPVRSILLISRCPVPEIRTLAADSSSRTSVELARVILDRRYGVQPDFLSHPPDLGCMLGAADAALVIGDPALHIAPSELPYHVYDLGTEWLELTGLPMVFAVWAARKGLDAAALSEAFHCSYRWGREHIDEIVALEARPRGFAPALAREYLTRHIVYELGDAEYEGMELFLSWARQARAVQRG